MLIASGGKHEFQHTRSAVGVHDYNLKLVRCTSVGKQTDSKQRLSAYTSSQVSKHWSAGFAVLNMDLNEVSFLRCYRCRKQMGNSSIQVVDIVRKLHAATEDD